MKTLICLFGLLIFQSLLNSSNQQQCPYTLSQLETNCSAFTTLNASEINFPSQGVSKMIIVADIKILETCSSPSNTPSESEDIPLLSFSYTAPDGNIYSAISFSIQVDGQAYLLGSCVYAPNYFACNHQNPFVLDIFNK